MPSQALMALVTAVGARLAPESGLRLTAVTVVLLPSHISVTPCPCTAGSVTWTPFHVPEAGSRRLVGESRWLPPRTVVL